jgi:hypothetical protein
MILRLKHEPVGGGVPQFMSEVEAGRHVVGRGDENSMVLDIESVSREHGCFFEARCRWFYCDLGSTNGSWVNGFKLGPSNIRLLRDGDLIQLANVAVRVAVDPPDDARSEYEEVPSLFIFQDREFKLELPFAGTCSRLALPNLPNLVIGQFGDLPAMTFVWRLGKIELVVVSDDARLNVNGAEWGGPAGLVRTLFDRDELDTGSAKVIVCDLFSAKVARERQIKAALATLPPAAGGGAKGGYCRESTKVLPRVSSQEEPSAPIGSARNCSARGNRRWHLALPQKD